MTGTIDDIRPAPATGLDRVPLTCADGVEAGGAIELMVAQRLGPSELRRLLGTGGMGQVFLAEQPQPPQRFALRRLREYLARADAPRSQAACAAQRLTGAPSLMRSA